MLEVLEGVDQIAYIGYAESGGLVVAGSATVEPVVTLFDIPQRCVTAVVAAGRLNEIQRRIQQADAVMSTARGPKTDAGWRQLIFVFVSAAEAGA